MTGTTRRPCSSVLRPAALGACLLFALIWSAYPVGAEEPPAPGWVTLPLADYLDLVERIDAREQSGVEGAEEAVAELASRRTTVVVDGDLATLETAFQVELRGLPTRPVLLPIAGLPAEATIEPRSGAALDRDSDGQLRLVAPEPGSYRVTVRGQRLLDESGGVFTLPLAATDAPVAETALDLPADLAWRAPGAVVAEDRVEGSRRRLRLALPRGRETVVELRRRATGAEEDRVLARAVRVTLLEVLPGSLRRHDVVLYEVLRGELGRFEVELPAGLEVEAAATDEGEVLPLVDSGRIRVERRRRLRGVGYLALTSRPALPSEGAALDLAPVVPSAPVRATYLVTANRVAASLEPRPEAAWTRVDEEDLPGAFRSRLGEFESGAVWRRTEAEGPVALALDLLPPVEGAEGVIRSRDTTTLLTVDGSLLFRDRLVLDAGRTALGFDLPDGAVLWSASVDGVPVRPVERGGLLTLPLSFRDRGTSIVEVVAVAAAAVPPGRSRIRLELPRFELRALEHSWRMLLPEGNRYRYAEGDLRPAPPPRGRASGAPASSSIRAQGPGGSGGAVGRVVDFDGEALPGVRVTLESPVLARPLVTVTDAGGTFQFVALPPGSYTATASLAGFSELESGFRLRDGLVAQVDLELSPAVEEVITVRSESPLLDRRQADELVRKRKAEEEERVSQAIGARALSELRQGLVGGVKPLAITIPESGKLIFLAGALPPPSVAVELEVKNR